VSRQLAAWGSVVEMGMRYALNGFGSFGYCAGYVRCIDVPQGLHPHGLRCSSNGSALGCLTPLSDSSFTSIPRLTQYPYA